MPTDKASQTVVVNAPLSTVLATVRDVAKQPLWVKEILEAEVLDAFEDGTPSTARFRAATPVGSDRYTLRYEHPRDGMTWQLVSGRLQTAQDGRYTLRRAGARRTEVTFDLQISHNLPLPRFIRSRVIESLVASTVTGLKKYLEEGQ